MILSLNRKTEKRKKVDSEEENAEEEYNVGKSSNLCKSPLHRKRKAAIRIKNKTMFFLITKMMILIKSVLINQFVPQFFASVLP